MSQEDSFEVIDDSKNLQFPSVPASMSIVTISDEFKDQNGNSLL